MFISAIFWFLIILVFYTYLGYPLIISACSFLKSIIKPKELSQSTEQFQPNVTLLVAAYNEIDYIPEKLRNTDSQDYPKNKIKQVWITDGSTDGTYEYLSKYPDILVIHHHERLGKAAAINRAVEHIKTPITILTDANTMLSSGAFSDLVKPFADPKTGCVAGEKGISMNNTYDIITSCEGIYWKYESLLKKVESKCGSALSAAGELYAIRTNLLPSIDEDIILDDFFISSKTIEKGFLIKYVATAVATENASLNIAEEKKRKERIAIGSFQFLFRFPELLNPFRNPLFAFQYFSHKVLRWLAVPFAIFLLPLINLLIIFYNPNPVYKITLLLVLIFYVFALWGRALKNTRLKNRFIFLPYYLIISNISLLKGLILYLQGKGNAKWEKSIRQT